MPTIEEIIKRATAIGLPITKNAWKKTAKKHAQITMRSSAV